MRAVLYRVFAVVLLCLGLCASAAAQTPPDVAAAQVTNAPAAAAPLSRPSVVSADTISAADTAWMMTSTALVLLMTLPGIA